MISQILSPSVQTCISIIQNDWYQEYGKISLEPLAREQMGKVSCWKHSGPKLLQHGFRAQQTYTHQHIYASLLNYVGSSNTEIQKSKSSHQRVILEEQIFRLEVSVGDVQQVTVLQSQSYLEKDMMEQPHLRGYSRIPLAQKAQDVKKWPLLSQLRLWSDFSVRAEIKKDFTYQEIEMK